MNRPNTTIARRIGPQLLAQQADDEHAFHEPVAEQVEGVEMMLLAEKLSKSQRCDPVVALSYARSSSVDAPTIASVLTR